MSRSDRPNGRPNRKSNRKPNRRPNNQDGRPNNQGRRPGRTGAGPNKYSSAYVWVGIIVVTLCIVFSLLETYKNSKNEENSTENPTTILSEAGTNNTSTPLDEELEIHFLDVNQGDCTIIKVGEHAMIIDAGNNGYGTVVKAYLQSLEIEKLDYVIGTHPDADHIGGLDVVIYNFDCGMVFMPDCTKDTKTYDDVVQNCENKNYKITSPVAGTEYKLGEATFTIIAPLHYDYDDNYNDCSIAIRMEYGDNSFLFTGDCEEAAEADLLESGCELDADLFKLAHHGSRTANTEEFLKVVTPAYCVVSCGEGNSYGHPHAEVLNNLRSMGIKLYRTDEQGTIVAYSDGVNITFNMSPSETWQVGE